MVGRRLTAIPWIAAVSDMHDVAQDAREVRFVGSRPQDCSFARAVFQSHNHRAHSQQSVGLSGGLSGGVWC